MQRQKYVRALEKFVRSNIACVKDEPFDFKTLQARVEKNYKVLKDIPALRLDASYQIALESYANMLLSVLDIQNEDTEAINQIRDTLLKEANLLHKEKMKTKYKKDKHRHKNFNDGY